jgi:SAM-dependent methyltransferase
MPEAVYDSIGRTYTTTRRPDPRVARVLLEALGDARSVVNVGAGSGSYEPTDRRLVAVEPSNAMLAQRSPSAAPAVRGVAEALPFADAAFDAALGILTLHHWSDWRRGVREMRRVARRRVVVLTWEVGGGEPFWLFDYFPGILALDAPRFPGPRQIADEIGGRGEVRPVLVPADCIDGFCGAFWARPHAYLDPRVRAGISGLSQLEPAEVELGVARLKEDLDSGRWQAAHGALVERREIDLAYRLVVAELS